MADGDELHGWRPDENGAAAAAPADLPVTAHRSDPETTVLTEEGNTDGWIASDTTVDLKR